MSNNEGGVSAMSAELGTRLQSEALMHAAKCRSWAAKTFNETPDAALCVEAGDRLLYAAQLLDAQSLEIERLRAAVAAERERWEAAVFDGWRVLKGLDDAAAKRTTHQNVSDTLDALMRVLRA